MLLDRRWHPVVYGAALMLLGGAPVASAQSGYQRPTTIIVPGSLGANVGAALRTLCKSGCEGTRWADRTFSDGIASQAITTDSTDFGDGAKTQLLGKLQASGAAREFILRQYLADKDFGWKVDGLVKRAQYAVTVAEAQKLIRAQTGIDPQTARLQAASYLFVVSSGKEEIKEGKGLLGGKTYDASADLAVAVYKLGYKTESDVMGGLGQFWCEPGCAGRDAKRAAFSAYQVPVEYVTNFTAHASGSVDLKEGQEKAWAEVAKSVLDEIIDETASAVSAFAVQEKIVAVGPPAARIGMKEGVKTGARYFVLQASQNGDGNGVTEKRGAMLLAKKVADNRKNSFESKDGVSQSIAQVDSTTFKQAYPGEVNRGDKIVEAPSEISLYPSLVMLDGQVGGALQVRAENLGLPVGVKLMLNLNGFGSMQDDTLYTLWTGVAAAGYEFMPMSGRLRVMPFLGFGRGGVTNTKSKEKAGFWATEFGLDMGVRVSPTAEITGTYKRLGIASVDAAGNPQAVFANAFQFGLRFQRGRWGF